ncbi:hypothetical protein TSAR_015095 [Trichomalopsis sarcophagae]|nr:hypothetical protein TSAR_015095 [Trichomalopsis sarcophagae]
MKLLIFMLLIVVTMSAAQLIPKIFGEPCNGAQNALCSTKCLFGNKICVKSEASLGYTCTCINA